MAKLKLFYATNRNHEIDKNDPSSTQWHPRGYGTRFSSHGRENLRFGELLVDAEYDKICGFLNDESLNSKGDGQGLAEYLSDCAKNAEITAYEEDFDQEPASVNTEKLGSSNFFNNLKTLMNKTQDVLVYIHGYSVSWHQAVGSALALQEMLNKSTPGYENPNTRLVNVVLFSWPSDGKKIPYASYKSDRIEAKDSGYAIGRGLLKLRDFLNMIPKDEYCGRDIHLLCHSMGNYVLQKSLKTIDRFHPGSRLPLMFKNIFMCSPDVDEDVLEPGKEMHKLVEMCRDVTVYYNRGDVAMYLSDYTKGNPDRLGHDGTAHPRLLHHKINQVDCSDVVTGLVEHSYYMNGNCNLDIRQSIHDLDMDDIIRPRKRTIVDNTSKLV